MAVAGGNLYAALRADLITDLPAGASGFDCMSASVPFYGMVFYGYASLCGTPLNTVDDWDEALLDCLEYGVAPAWQLTGCSNRALRETSLSFLYNTAADEVAERAISLLERYEETAARLDGGGCSAIGGKTASFRRRTAGTCGWLSTAADSPLCSRGSLCRPVSGGYWNKRGGKR